MVSIILHWCLRLPLTVTGVFHIIHFLSSRWEGIFTEEWCRCWREICCLPQGHFSSMNVCWHKDLRRFLFTGYMLTTAGWLKQPLNGKKTTFFLNDQKLKTSITNLIFKYKINYTYEMYSSICFHNVVCISHGFCALLKYRFRSFSLQLLQCDCSPHIHRVWKTDFSLSKCSQCWQLGTDNAAIVMLSTGQVQDESC